ncbi:MAG: thioredoxin-disulfide reductase [Candidatus Roizmanbacteria bacterium]|nr:thioredoxin-disulfide reductase [Candidatus Roizmanbacteria bacterium]
MNTPLAIIGSGPAGLAAAIYASRAGLKPVLIEGVPPGGQLMRTTDVENYPGFPKGILGPELVTSFSEQAKRFGTEMLATSVSNITVHENKPHTIALENGSSITARAVIIATGADAQWLNVPGENEYMGKGVSACATCDGFFFRGKTVGVVGGGDTAMEEALTLSKIVKKVILIHRRDTFRASRIMQERVLTAENIEIILNTSIIEVQGDKKLTGVILSTRKELPLDGLFVAIGHKPSTTFLQGSGVLLDKKGYIYTSGRIALEGKIEELPDDQFNFTYQYATSVPGIFAAGDCIDHVYRQATTAIGMGVAAELEAQRYLSDAQA